jgi:S1-C subfamily serine protease
VLFPHMKFTLIAVALVGCTHSPPSKAPATSDAPRVREVASPRVCLGKRRLLEALGKKDLAAAAAKPSDRVETEPASARGIAPVIQDAYRVAAPATVLIRTRDGMGSGVVVDAKRGLVLTNHHVIGDLLGEDLTIHLTLELGKVLPTGRMVTTGEALEGVVVKTDPVKDLAIVKLVKPPANLVEAKVSEFDPRVGENVMSIGNAGIGLLWAAKVCNVSKIGEPTRETSMLEAGDCMRADATKGEVERTHHREQCQARKQEIKKQVEMAPQALSIQTTCGINGGDSGGPLVNAWGQIVGLNQSVRYGANTLAFHVHVAEIRELMRDIPQTPATIIPDPFCDGGSEIVVDDFDGDGTIDTASAPGTTWEGGEVLRQGTYLFDLAQNAKHPITADHPFDAQVALVLHHDDAYAFYDTDGDGVFDVMFRDDKADGTPERAYRLRGGRATLDPSLLGRKTLDPSLVRGAVPARLGAAIAGLGFGKLTTAEVIAAADVPPIPDVKRAFGEDGFAQDMDGDGNVDVIFARDREMNHSAMMFDVRSKVLASLKPGDSAAPALKSGELHPQYVSIERPAGVWALYDTTASGHFDLALFSKRPTIEGNDRFAIQPQYATHAFALAPGKAPQPLREHIGRNIIRADLFKDPALRHSFERNAMWRHGGRGALPDPLQGASGMGDTWHLSALEHDRQVLEESSRIGHVALVDLDRDTKKLATRAAEDLAKPGEFDAEIAIVREVDLGWFFYDTDGDGAYDVVTFTRDFDKGIADNVFKLDPTGEKVTVGQPGGPAFRPELVHASPKAKDKLAALVARMAKPARK